jgi:cob(I)alamin adenosyltransferase
MVKKKTFRSSIYTKVGDKGITSLPTGRRVAKDDVYLEAYGNIDELNSVIGIVLSNRRVRKNIRLILKRIQQELFELSSDLGDVWRPILNEAYIKRLENEIDQLDAKLPKIKGFISPTGTSAAAHCHLARAVCRRAERSIVALSQRTQLNPYILVYINRLSDLLFVIARGLSR